MLEFEKESSFKNGKKTKIVVSYKCYEKKLEGVGQVVLVTSKSRGHYAFFFLFSKEGKMEYVFDYIA